MKKLFVIALAAVMVLTLTVGMAMAYPNNIPSVGTSTSSGGSQTVTIQCNVLKYVAVNPAYATITPGMGDIGVIDPPASPPWGFRAFVPEPAFVAYSNCPFSITMSDSPTLKRLERDYSGASLGRYDYLWTQVKYSTVVNAADTDYQWIIQAFQGDLTNPTGSWTPGTAYFTTPHNGLVEVLIHVSAKLDPNVAPDFTGPSTKPYTTSQDAGVYTGSFVATYAAL